MKGAFSFHIGQLGDASVGAFFWGLASNAFQLLAAFWTGRRLFTTLKKVMCFLVAQADFLSVYPCLDTGCQERSFIEPLALNLSDRKLAGHRVVEGHAGSCQVLFSGLLCRLWRQMTEEKAGLTHFSFCFISDADVQKCNSRKKDIFHCLFLTSSLLLYL